MARMDHVTKIGRPIEAPGLYLEDYVYTYLKRQEDVEFKKYYLYGEKEGSQGQEKLYVYGISDTAKVESTYFRDYYPLGFLKIKNGEKYLAGRKGQDIHITGFYVFYAPNQNMQEYLVDTSSREKEEDKLKAGRQREATGKPFSIKERIIFAPRGSRRAKKGVNLGNLVFYAGCVLALFLFAIAITGGNGYEKLADFRQMVLQTTGNSILETEEFIVEEQRAGDIMSEAEMSLESASIPYSQEIVQEEKESSTEAVTEQESPEATAGEMNTVEANTTETEVSETDAAKESYESYVVQEGDTLAQICQIRYGSTSLMKEICEYNNIENEDHIAPGQKLYLPK